MKRPRKRKMSFGPFEIVSNDDNYIKSTKKGGRIASSSWRYSTLSNATKANRANRKYEIVKKADRTLVRIRDKTTGRTISEFSVRSNTALKSIRKFDLQPKVGSISRKKIFDAI